MEELPNPFLASPGHLILLGLRQRAVPQMVLDGAVEVQLKMFDDQAALWFTERVEVLDHDADVLLRLTRRLQETIDDADAVPPRILAPQPHDGMSVSKLSGFVLGQLVPRPAAHHG